MPNPLTLDILTDALATRAAAFRCRRRLQPAAGEGTKIFPPTYAGATYAVERRRINGQSVLCVLVDSVASQANWMEEALQAAYDDKLLSFPLIVVDFAEANKELQKRVDRDYKPHRAAPTGRRNPPRQPAEGRDAVPAFGTR